MGPREYNRAVAENLLQGFEGANWAGVVSLESTNELRLSTHGNRLPFGFVDIKDLAHHAFDFGSETYYPVPGAGCEEILFPYDYEIFLEGNPTRLYGDVGSQWHYFQKYVFPVTMHLKERLDTFDVPRVFDFTPSGGHALFKVKRGTLGWEAVKSIGCVGLEQMVMYSWTDETGRNIRRREPVDLEAALVFNGLTRLAEFLSLDVIKNGYRIIPWDKEGREEELRITLCDAGEKLVNLDVSWGSYPANIRFMRAACGLHNKVQMMADAKFEYYDTNVRLNSFDLYGKNTLLKTLEAMWDLKKGAEHNNRFPGYIPYANEGLAMLVDAYKQSGLYLLHQWFDGMPDLAKDEARSRALNDPRLSLATKHMVMYPRDRMITPIDLRKHVADYIRNIWHPKHVSNVLKDCYDDARHNWTFDFVENPSETHSRFWARIYTSRYFLDNPEHWQRLCDAKGWGDIELV